MVPGLIIRFSHSFLPIDQSLFLNWGKKSAGSLLHGQSKVKSANSPSALFYQLNANLESNTDRMSYF